MELANSGADQKNARSGSVSLNSVMTNAVSALRTNSAALDVVSSNLANVNTAGYAKRVVNEQAQSAAGQLAGVQIADIERARY